MNGGSIEDLVNDLSKVDGQIKTVKSKVDALGGKVKEIDTIFTELNEAVSQINEVGNMVVIEPATPKKEEGGLFDNFFTSSAVSDDTSDVKTAESSDDKSDAKAEESNNDKTEESKVMSPLNNRDLDVSSYSSVPSELNNGMMVNDSDSKDYSDSEMKDALTESDTKGGRSRKNQKQKNAKSKKLRGGKRTKRRNQKKGGAKKSKRRA
jgi:hypothetical protein